ncbi:metabotropic glutamate receptor 3-like isoform X1 [Styela clava]
MDLFDAKSFCFIVMNLICIKTLTNASEEYVDPAEVIYGDLVQFRDGHIIIAVLLPITTSDENENCRNEFRNEGIQMVEQVNMAIEKVNADENFLPGIKIGTVIINTCLSVPNTLTKVIFDVLRKYILDNQCHNSCLNPDEPRILAGVLGAMKSSVSMQIARLLQVFYIPQISYFSTNPELSDKNRFQYFFRTVPSDTKQTLAMTHFIEQMGWNYVSVLYENDPYGINGNAEIVHHFKDNNICFAETILVEVKSNMGYYIGIVDDLMKKSTANAVILFMGAWLAEKIITATKYVEGAENKFTWMASDAWIEYLPYSNADEAFIQSIDGSIGFRPNFVHNQNLSAMIENITLDRYQGLNKTLNPWWEHYISNTNNCSLQKGNMTYGKRICSSNETISGFTHLDNSIEESVMVFVHALNSYHQDICTNITKENGLCGELRDMSGTNILAKELYHYIKNVSFTTDDGRLFEFDENQDAPSVYRISIYNRNMSSDYKNTNGWTPIKTYDDKGFHNYNVDWRQGEVSSVCSQPCMQGQAKKTAEQLCCWFCQNCTERQFVSNGTECVDCSEDMMPNAEQDQCILIPIQKLEYDSGYTIGCLVVGVFGLLCTSFVTAIYIKFRHTAIVRASGMELCFFVLFGIFFTLTNCFVITAPPTIFSCALSRVILAIGPACMYSGLLVKTIRVVFIFHSKRIMSTRTKAYLEPVPILFITLLVVVVQIVILIPWLVINNPKVTVKYYENEAFLTCEHIINEEIFVGIAYPFVIIIICTILATINRNAPTGFRETLFIGFAMYTTCVTWIAFLPLFFTHSAEIFKQLTTISVALSVSAITVLFCLFVPRCYTMVFYPEFNTSESVMGHTGSFTGTKPPRPKAKTVDGVENNAYSMSPTADAKPRST